MADELIDQLDERGNKTGRVIAKSLAHKNGLWHRAVHIWVINFNGEVLLQKRSSKKENHPGYWDISVGGHVSAGEDALRSALREVKEEIGLTVSNKDLKLLGTTRVQSVINNGIYINNEVNEVYVIQRDVPLNQLNRQVEEVDELMWVSIEEFKTWVKDKKEDLIDHPEEYKLLFDYIDSIN